MAFDVSKMLASALGPQAKEQIAEIYKIFTFVGHETHANSMMLERICEKLEIDIADIKELKRKAKEGL